MSKIKSLPLDVKLLRLGLDYAQKRARNEDLSALYENPENPDLLKNIDTKFYQNLHFLHAKVHENPPQIELKCGGNFREILHCDMEINKIIRNAIFQVNPVLSPEVKVVNGLTTLDLLSVVVPFTIADATCDLGYHRPHMAEDIEAFGLKGADEIEAFFMKEMKHQNELGLPAYKIEWPFEACLEESKVTLDFECVIQGYEGRGTDNVFVNSDKRIKKINAVRH